MVALKIIKSVLGSDDLMNLTRCSRGHFYDAERYSKCPHCNNDSSVVLIPKPEEQLCDFYNLTLIKKGFYEDKEIFFRGNQIGVGKESNVCPIRLESIYGSRLHAKFVNQDGCWGVIDTNSTNGTKINGKQIEPNRFCKLNDKDEISFSSVDIYIYVENKDEETFYCYNCGRKIIKKNDKLPLICNYCNEKQEIVDKETTTLICRNCYNCNYVTDSFCRKCGKPLKETVINKLDYYICIYSKTIDSYFEHKVNGIHILANGQMTNASLKINYNGDEVLFALDPDDSNKVKITLIYTGGQYRFLQGYHKETVKYALELDKICKYDYYGNFGDLEKRTLFYFVSKKPILPDSIIGEYVFKWDGFYLSKVDLLKCLTETAEKLTTFAEQINSQNSSFVFNDFDELLHGKTVPLDPVILGTEDDGNDL